MKLREIVGVARAPKYLKRQFQVPITSLNHKFQSQVSITSNHNVCCLHISSCSHKSQQRPNHNAMLSAVCVSLSHKLLQKTPLQKTIAAEVQR